MEIFLGKKNPNLNPIRLLDLTKRNKLQGYNQENPDCRKIQNKELSFFNKLFAQETKKK